jgi:prolyl 4-hydroxylase
MQTITQLTPQWRDWIRENLARGCAVQSLVEDMVRNRFEPAFASAAVRGMQAGMAEPAALPQAAGYVAEPSRLPAGNRILAADREVQVALRLERPAIAVLDGVLGHDECDELIRRASAKLRRSTIVDPATGRHETIADRSSEGTFFAINADDFIARLDQRVSTLMGLPVEHGEGLQVLHYGPGGEYKPHFDYFPPDDPGSASPMAVGGQRVSTLVMYLNAVEDGGATIFPELGLSVLPKKGSAVYFEYANSHGQLDPLTLHGGAPVLRGEKWIVTKWMRQRPYGTA